MMFRLSSSICPFCEARAIARTIPWQPSRSAASLQKRRPSRMVLSSTVQRAPSPSPHHQGGDAKKRKSRNSPFGGMNVTTVPRDIQSQPPDRTQPRPERRRRNAPAPIKKRDGGRKQKDPMHALKMQRALANISYEKRGRIKQDLMQRDSFDDFALLPIIRDSIPTQALAGMADIRPTPVQRIAIPALLDATEPTRRKRQLRLQPLPGEAAEVKPEMQQFLLAAETGSGKTLAYLLPIIDALKRAELLEKADESTQPSIAAPRIASHRTRFPTPTPLTPNKDTARPRALILLPTAELVAQVGALAKSLSHTVKFRAALLSSALSGPVIRSRLFTTAGVDLVITTPHLLHSIAESDPNVLARVTHMVVDEADSLFDRSFAPLTQGIIERATPSLRQLVLCSATIPRSLDRLLGARYPRMKRLVTPNLHAVPRRVRLDVVDVEKVPYQGNRKLACAQVLNEILKEAVDEDDGEMRGRSTSQRREKKVVVFVNERDEVEELATFLRSKGIDALGLTRDSQDRKAGANVLDSFTKKTAHNTHLANPTPSPPPPRPPHPLGLAHSPADIPYIPNVPVIPYTPPPSTPAASPPSAPSPSVLITTDLASRGLDTQALRHLILFSPPHTTVDFIHRLGRLGRMGQRGGRAVVLVGKGDRRDVVREVRAGMFRGGALI